MYSFPFPAHFFSSCCFVFKHYCCVRECKYCRSIRGHHGASFSMHIYGYQFSLSLPATVKRRMTPYFLQGERAINRSESGNKQTSDNDNKNSDKNNLHLIVWKLKRELSFICLLLSTRQSEKSRLPSVAYFSLSSCLNQVKVLFWKRFVCLETAIMNSGLIAKSLRNAIGDNVGDCCVSFTIWTEQNIAWKFSLISWFFKINVI